MRLILRDATSTVHDHIHHAPVFADLAAGRLTMDGYRGLLACLHRFHLATDAAVAGARVRLGLQPTGERLSLLAADLATLGGALASRPGAMPMMTTPDQAVGCLYVVEGSALGGKVIYRQLDYLFGQDRDGRRFFGGVADGGARWRNLCEMLDATADMLDIDEVISGAKAAFALFEHCLAETVA